MIEKFRGVILKVDASKVWADYFLNMIEIEPGLEEVKKFLHENLGFKGVKKFLELKRSKSFELGIQKIEIQVKQIAILDNRIGKFKIEIFINEKKLDADLVTEFFYEVLRSEDFGDGYDITNRRKSIVYILHI